MADPAARLTVLSGKPVWRATAAAVALIALSLAWYSGTWSTAGQRVEDYAQLDHLARSGNVLAGIAAWWLAFCDNVLRMDVVVALLQAALVAAVAGAAWAWTRSAAASAVVALIALASPFPGYWLDRPIGAADALTAIAMIALLGGIDSDRRGQAVRCAGAFLAVLISGWPAFAVVAYALVMRGRSAAPLLLAVAAALAARLAIGFPLDRAVGSLHANSPNAVAVLRFAVFIAFAIPALLYLVTAPSAARYVGAVRAALGRRAFAAVALAVVLIGVAGFARPGAATAAYVAELAIVLAVAAAIVNAPAAWRRTAAGIAAIVFVAACAGRVDHRTQNDDARVANDRRVMRTVAGATSFVFVQDPAASQHYPPSLLAYYAGRDVHPVLADKVPDPVHGPVVVAYSGGLNRVDDAARAVHALATARGRTSFDLYAHSAEGRINDRTHQPTPSGLGVISTLPLPGPYGPVSSIIVLGTFTYTFDRVPVGPGSRLVYAAAKVIPVGDVVRATVQIEVDGRRIEQHDDLPAAPADGSLSWQFRSVAVPATRRTTARIVFAATSPTGNGLGNWAAFGSPAIVDR